MVRDCRIKEYYFAAINASANSPSQFTDHAINGEILKIVSFSNFTGSIQLYVSGQSIKLTDFTTGSDTNKWESFALSNTTGSYVVNAPIQFRASGVQSGTAVVFGPVSILYR